jgi:hypothetical protein
MALHTPPSPVIRDSFFLGGKILVFIVRNTDKVAYRYKYQTQRIQRRPWTPSSTSGLPEISNHRGDRRLRDATAAEDLGTGEPLAIRLYRTAVATASKETDLNQTKTSVGGRAPCELAQGPIKIGRWPSHVRRPARSHYAHTLRRQATPRLGALHLAGCNPYP